MLQVDQKKLGRQIQGLNRWRRSADLNLSHANGWGTLWWETGTGKTYATCIVINKMIEKDSSSTVYIIVPGHELEKQWKEQVRMFVKEEYQSNINIITVEKIVNNGYQIVCTLLVVDEVHEFLSEERLKVLNGTYVTMKFLLALTATFEDRHKRHEKIISICPVVDRIDEDEAIREGFISKYIEFNVKVNLTENEKLEYNAITKEISKLTAVFGRGGLEIANKCLNGDKSTGKSGKDICYIISASKGYSKSLDLTREDQRRIFDLYSPSRIMGYAKTFMELIRRRKDILYCAEEKLPVAVNAFFKFNTLKTIFFSQSTGFASRISNTINAHNRTINPDSDDICGVYHSKLVTQVIWDEKKGKQVKKGKTKLKKEVIDAIRTGKIRGISTASSLDKGFDVKDIRMGITTSGTQNPTQRKQRSGRVKRIESYEENITVLIVNIYVAGTKDEEWLRNTQKKSTNVVYWVNSVDDITYSPKSNRSFNLNDI